MLKRLFLLVAVVALLSWPLTAGADEPVVRLLLFYSESCPHCQAILNDYLPGVREKYGAQLEIQLIEISDSANFQKLLAIEAAYGVTEERAGIPEVFVGDQVLIGEEEVRARLEGLIDRYLAQGGVDYPAIPDPATPQPGPVATATSIPRPVARFFLFQSKTCPHCRDILENYLPGLRDRYEAQIEIRMFEISESPDNYRIMLSLEKVYGIAEEEAGVPLIFIGDQYLIGSEAIRAELEPLIDSYLVQGGVDYPSLEDLPDVPIPTPAPHVHLLVFYSQDCAECSPIVNEYLSDLLKKYGHQMEINVGDVDNPQNARLLQMLLAAYGVPPEQANQHLALFISDQLLLGAAEIQARLEALIDGYLATGGVELPNLEQILASDTSASAKPTIHMAYFLKAGCQECARANYNLNYVKTLYPQLVIAEFPIEESSALSEWLGERYGVPEEKRLTTPMVFVGEDYLVGGDVSVEKLQAVLDRYVGSGAKPTWGDFDASQAEASILDRFKSFGLLTVVGAGLVDGLNPCAFATIVFFISYLAFLGRKGREILIVGATFALGVFLTYLLVGIGLLKVLERLPFLMVLGRWMYGLTAVLCLGLAILSFLDYRKVRGGQAQDMTLRIPLALRRRINSIIRRGARARTFVPVAFVTGFAVSIIELACTGQVYLPTIIFVMSVPKMRVRAFFYLLLYNLVFILPLVVVFGLAFFGTTSEQLGRFINRRMATVKLATSGLFLILAGWLIYALI